jgi:hypothetical protein
MALIFFVQAFTDRSAQCQDRKNPDTPHAL